LTLFTYTLGTATAVCFIKICAIKDHNLLTVLPAYIDFQFLITTQVLTHLAKRTTKMLSYLFVEYTTNIHSD